MNVIEGRFFLDGRLEKCCVGIEDGKITAIKKILKGEEHFDFGDRIILPGCIDPHVHFREPGDTNKEDFHTGTMAAAFGGVTCVLDMPNNSPPVNDAQSYGHKLGLVREKANVDFGLYSALVSEEALAQVSEITTGFKVYMAESTNTKGITAGFDDLENLVITASKIKPVSIHCEDAREMMSFPEKSLSDHLRARPTLCEVRALKTVMNIAMNAPGNVHVAHLTSAHGVEMVKNARQSIKITSEVTPHHMLLNSGMNLGAFGKVNPPLRRNEDNDALRTAFFNGSIDILVSDHAPHTIEEKGEGFSSAPSGIPGVETSVPITLPLLKKNLMSLNRFVDATSALPARIFGLNKGAIRVGCDGDLIVVDMKDVKKIKSDELHSKCGWTPFEGFEAIFPQAVFLRGEMIVKDGNLLEERNGRFIGE
jgi:dihydroorotase